MPDTHSCYAITPPGIEAITAQELTAFGITPGKVEPGGIEFPATPAQLYGANLLCRTASRFIVRVAEFTARTFFELERHGKKVPWGRFVAPKGTVSFRVTSRKSKLYHQGAIEERFLRWAGEAGYEGEKGRGKGEEGDGEEGRENGERRKGKGEGEVEGPFPSSPFSLPQKFLVRLHRDRVTISADSSGELLHRRGYRLATAKAPLRENLAAAMLLASGWDPSSALIDPFCGSGTIPIEAALISRNIAPGIRRSFAFERWPEFEVDGWKAVKDKAVNGERSTVEGPILGSDQDAGAITAARANAERAGVLDDIVFEQVALESAYSREARPGAHVVTNPPYGVRVGEGKGLGPLYERLGRFVKERAPGGSLTLLAADPQLAAQVGLPLQERFRTENGGIGVACMVGRCQVLGTRY